MNLWVYLFFFLLHLEVTTVLINTSKISDSIKQHAFMEWSYELKNYHMLQKIIKILIIFSYYYMPGIVIGVLCILYLLVFKANPWYDNPHFTEEKLNIWEDFPELKFPKAMLLTNSLQKFGNWKSNIIESRATGVYV